MARRSGSWPGRTGGSCRCTATGCSDPSPTPRTPSRRRCWPPGKASAGSPRNARCCAPGCTRSPPTGASTRPRASRQRRQHPAAGHQPPPAAAPPAEDAIVATFARAWQSADLDALVALLTDDVFIAMPPEPFGYEGRELVARYCARQFAAGRRFDLVPTRANGQPAFGAYLRGPAGIRHATAFYVLTLTGDRICGMTRFEASVLPWFGLPRSLPSR